MAPDRAPTLAEELASALEWWREAGVDRTFGANAKGWLAEPAKESAPAEERAEESAPPIASAAPEQARQLGGPREDWPTDLAAFRRWWVEEDSLDGGGSFARVPPRGERGADLMLVVAMPEASDDATLLSGPQGAILSGILAAMGVAPERTYLASALPRHTPLPDWDELAAAGLGRVLAHHIELAQPSRLILFGRLVPPLLGHDMAQGAAAIPKFNHEGGRVPVMAAVGLDRLLSSAAARATFWRRWLEWTDGAP